MRKSSFVKRCNLMQFFFLFSFHSIHVCRSYFSYWISMIFNWVSVEQLITIADQFDANIHSDRLIDNWRRKEIAKIRRYEIQKDKFRIGRENERTDVCVCACLSIDRSELIMHAFWPLICHRNDDSKNCEQNVCELQSTGVQQEGWSLSSTFQ